jgi:hypothetical protein
MLATIALAVLILVNGCLAYFIWLRRWRPYDPSWLVALAQAQHPDKPWLVASLQACTRAQIESRYYTRFVSSHRRSRPGSTWQFDCNLSLRSERDGDLVLDILKGGRVGGVEFVSRRPGGDA